MRPLRILPSSDESSNTTSLRREFKIARVGCDCDLGFDFEREPRACPKNCLNSPRENLLCPSAILLATETAARRNCAVRPNRSSFREPFRQPVDVCYQFHSSLPGNQIAVREFGCCGSTQ